MSLIDTMRTNELAETVNDTNFLLVITCVQTQTPDPRSDELFLDSVFGEQKKIRPKINQ